MVQTDPRADSEAQNDAPTSDPASNDTGERPQLAPNVVLAGEMQDGAYEQQQWLVQRDGQFVQLTEFLYRVAEQIDGRRGVDEIAEAVSQSIDRSVSADNVRQLLSAKLIPLGLVTKADGSVVEQQGPAGGAAARSPLQINMRVRALNPRFINPFTAVLQKLFWPPILIALLIVSGAAQFYVFVIHGVASSVHDVLYHPALMFVVLGMIIVGTIWHEFGHASALRYGGGEVRGMGFGIYLVYPAFYTDVTDNYRLPRWSKVRTDLGGFYFNLIFGAIMVGFYFVTHQVWLLLIVMLIDVEIIQQTLPFGRYDGYWTLADITGIPDFFSRIPAFVRSALPFMKTTDAEFSQYKVWVRVVFALYIIVTAPVMAFIFFLMIKSAPRVLATGWDSAHKQLNILSTAHTHGDLMAMVLAAVQLLILTLPTLGLIYILFNLARRGGRALWNYSKPSGARRIKGSLIALATTAFLAYLWAPQLPTGGGRSGPLYAASAWQPIRPSERGTVGDAGDNLAQVPVPYNPFHRSTGASRPITHPASGSSKSVSTKHRTPASPAPHSRATPVNSDRLQPTAAIQATATLQPTVSSQQGIQPTLPPTSQVTTPEPAPTGIPTQQPAAPVAPAQTAPPARNAPAPPPPPTLIPTTAP